MTHPDDPTTPSDGDGTPEPSGTDARLPDWQRPSAPAGHDRASVLGAYDTSGGDPFDRPGSPREPYSAHRPTYQQPPPGNGWKVATIVLSIVLGLVVLGFGGLMVLGFVVASGQLTSSELQQGVTSSCEDLAAAADDLDLLGDPDAVQSGLGDLAEAARAIADDADDAATDSGPDDRFVRDSADLADVLQELADDPAAGFELPTRDGTPITVRMTTSTPTCLVPPVVTALDPDAGEDLVVSELVPF